MNKRPIRRKFKDNPYTLLCDGSNYYICFKNNEGYQKVIVEKSIFDLFDENERYENSRYYEYSVHIEHFDLSEEEIYIKNNLYCVSIWKKLY